MLHLEPRWEAAERLSALFIATIQEPAGVSFDPPRGRGPGRLVIGHDADNVDVAVHLQPGIDTKAFLEELLSSVQDAIAWNNEHVCSRCAQDVVEVGHLCRHCIQDDRDLEERRRAQEEHDREMAASAWQEHLEADRRERQADFAAQAAAERIGRREVA